MVKLEHSVSELAEELKRSCSLALNIPISKGDDMSGWTNSIIFTRDMTVAHSQRALKILQHRFEDMVKHCSEDFMNDAHELLKEVDQNID